MHYDIDLGPSLGRDKFRMGDNPTGTQRTNDTELGERIVLMAPIKGQHGGRETVEQRMFLTISLNTISTLGMVVNKPMTETSSRDLFPGALEMMILESLRRQPAHGYSLVQNIQQRSNNLLQVEEGSLYPALQRLLKAKLVKAEWGLSTTNRRVRTYQITASGLRHLEQQISSFERMFEGISLVLNPARSPAS